MSKHAAEVLRRFAPRGRDESPVGLNWWYGRDVARDEWVASTIYGDPSVHNQYGTTNGWGAPASIATEFRDHGIYLSRASNDRRAGYLRILELLHPEKGRIPPPWSRIPADLGMAPRLYVFSTCTHLIDQIRNAPVKADGSDAGEMVDPTWESAHGAFRRECPLRRDELAVAGGRARPGR